MGMGRAMGTERNMGTSRDTGIEGAWGYQGPHIMGSPFKAEVTGTGGVGVDTGMGAMGEGDWGGEYGGPQCGVTRGQ